MVLDISAEPWDLLVVGGGTAGIVGAQTAAALGAQVLLVERDRMGGDCLWTGCVPSKSLLAAAAAVARPDADLGVGQGGPVDFEAVMRHVRGAVSTIAPVDSAESMTRAGVTVVAGAAVFTGREVATVDGRPVRFRQALVATGSEPAIPEVAGLDPSRVLTSNTVWDLAQLPARLVVLGGGGIGCELGQAFARLGSHVTLIEASSQVLPREDPDAAALLHPKMEADGVAIVTGSGVCGVAYHNHAAFSGTVQLTDGRCVEFDRLLVSTGRTPRTTEVGLVAAGVELDERGYVRVDSRLRSSNPRIWAAGDITGYPQLTHVAGVHGSIAATNAVLGLRRSARAHAIPRVTFTHPEVAAIGASTTQPPAGGRILTLRHEHVDRAVTEGETDGMTRLAVDRRGRLVGATIVGPRAGESLAEVALAIDQKLRPRDLAGVTHAYPTYADGVWNATVADVRASLRAPSAARTISALVGVRRTWLDMSARVGREPRPSSQPVLPVSASASADGPRAAPAERQ
ncbi:MAG: FAD-dependent oxidoreductase [Actinomycetota bacterium]|nr:FAD-dependent oxidoreductase [Actinomycetota bacterium]